MSLSHNQSQPPWAGGFPASIEDFESFLAAIARAASSEPAAVFSSLAEACVPAFCDECAVVLEEEGQPAQWTRYPPADGDHHVESVAQRDGNRKVSAYFEIAAEADSGPRCAGVVTYSWHRAAPSAADRVFARLLTDRAAAIVLERRRIVAAELAAAAIENLKAGLATSRQIALAIGILMATHKLAEPDAFAMLRTVSQREHRKVRDIAAEVVLTGEIEQSPQPVGRRRRPRTGHCTKG